MGDGHDRLHIGRYMADTLVSLRKAKHLTQQQLGEQLSEFLGATIGPSYAQKKVARFEAGLAAPTDQELQALAKILRVKLDLLREIVARAPKQAEEIITQVASKGRSLIATCMLARPRPEPLAESSAAIRSAVEEKDFSVAVFLPYPGVVHIPDARFHDVSNLVGYYARVINDVTRATLAFKRSLKKRVDAVALYTPKPEILKSSALLIPPIFRQFSLTVHQADPPSGPITKALNAWTVGSVTDTSRPIKGTGTYTLDDQIDAWQSYFGQVVSNWIDHSHLIEEDDYWKKIR
jgi:transcriptional regulator with XRE-family HTH domain